MILFWIVAGLIFLKCLSWVLAPLQREPDQYHEHHYHHYSIDVDITDSFHTDNSYFKGGAYYGTKEEDTNKTRDTYDFGEHRRRY